MNNTSNTVVVATSKTYGGNILVYYCSKHKIEAYGGVENIPLYVCGTYITHSNFKKEN